ncbi:MAG: ATP-binding cassette, subfamily bacterial [Halanaerobiales bacterium]|nr:ATP-binding cassette, subfamily bacterial [Halanaerobiales bacterium]
MKRRERIWFERIDFPRFFMEHRQLTVMLILLLAACGFFTTYPVKLLARTIDLATGSLEGGIGAITYTGLVFLGLHLLNNIIQGLLTFCHRKAEATLVYDIRCKVFSHLSGVSQSVLERLQSGELMARMVEDTQVAVGGFLRPIIFLSKSMVSFFFGVYFMLSIDRRLTVLILLLGAITVVFTAKTGLRLRRYAAEVRSTVGRLWSLYTEGIRGMRDIQVNGQQVRFCGEVNFWSERVKAISLKEAAYLAITKSAGGSLLMSIIAGVIIYGGLLVAGGSLSVGGLAAVMMYNGLIVTPMLQFIGLYQDLQRVMVSVGRINEILREPIQLESKNPVSMHVMDATVSFRGVFFAYDREQYVLRDITFTVKAGEKVAFVGKSGAGKSSILKLIAGFYSPQAGEIIVGGLKLDRKSIGAVREITGIVFQNNFLFDGTLEENIRFGNPGAKNEELKRAVRLAEIESVIAKLPRGLATQVGENGVRLSAGERQRIGLARAILRHPKLLLLDEVTSALDNITAARIIHNIAKEIPECTVIHVSHNLHNISGVDRIFILEDGLIVEEGRHKELMVKRGLYRRLYDIEA